MKKYLLLLVLLGTCSNGFSAHYSIENEKKLTPLEWADCTASAVGLFYIGWYLLKDLGDITKLEPQIFLRIIAKGAGTAALLDRLKWYTDKQENLKYLPIVALVTALVDRAAVLGMHKAIFK